MFKKKILFVYILAILSFFIIGCDELASNYGNNYVDTKATESRVDRNKEYIGLVAESFPKSEISLKDGFDNFFASPRWMYFEGSNGEDVVEFKGKCYVDDVLSDVRIQYLLVNGFTEYELGYMEYNNVAQDGEEYNDLLNVVFGTTSDTSTYDDRSTFNCWNCQNVYYRDECINCNACGWDICPNCGACGCHYGY